MGIQGLLLGLKPYTESANICDFKGQAIAVDASSWLHRSVYCIADHYVECVERNAIDAKCINVSAKYMQTRCQELLVAAQVAKVYLVFDGKRCPLKAGTNQGRDDRRAENLRLARSYGQQNRTQDMHEKYKSCIKIIDALTNAVAAKLLNIRNVELVWSPYEADAQLVQLCVDRRANAVITEDSDVLVYSASTQTAFPIIYKLDRNTGVCDVVSLDFFLNSSNSDVRNKKVADATEQTSQFQVILSVLAARQARTPGWGARLFVQACILSGCDYASRLPGNGLVTAFKLVKNAGLTGSPYNLAKVFRNVLNQVSIKCRKAMLEQGDYEGLLSKCEAVFYYHPVALADGRVVHLNQPSECAPNLERFADASFLGCLMANPNENCIIPAHALKQQSSRTKNEKTSRHASKPIHHFFARRRDTHDASVTSSLTAPTVAKKPPVFSVSKMNNPYRQPLESCSPSKLNSRRKQSPEKKAPNPFADFTFREKDVRFVKRTFPKDGSRSTLDAPLNLFKTKERTFRTPLPPVREEDNDETIPSPVDKPSLVTVPRGKRYRDSPKLAQPPKHNESPVYDVDDEPLVYDVDQLPDRNMKELNAPYFDYDNDDIDSPDQGVDAENLFSSSPNLLEESPPYPTERTTSAFFDNQQAANRRITMDPLLSGTGTCPTFSLYDTADSVNEPNDDDQLLVASHPEPPLARSTNPKPVKVFRIGGKVSSSNSKRKKQRPLTRFLNNSKRRRLESAAATTTT